MSTTKAVNRSVEPFLHSSQQKVPILYNRRVAEFRKVAQGGATTSEEQQQQRYSVL